MRTKEPLCETKQKKVQFNTKSQSFEGTTTFQKLL